MNVGDRTQKGAVRKLLPVFVLFTYYRAHTKENEIRGTWSIHGEDDKCIQPLMRADSLRKLSFGRPRMRCKYRN